MEWLIWIGVAVTLAGIGALVYCVVATLRARASGLAENALRARLRHIVNVNTGALAVSALGLVMVVAGILLA